MCRSNLYVSAAIHHVLWAKGKKAVEFIAEDLRKILNYILKTGCSKGWLSKKGHGIQEKWPFCVFFQELLGFFLSYSLVCSPIY